MLSAGLLLAGGGASPVFANNTDLREAVNDALAQNISVNFGTLLKKEYESAPLSDMEQSSRNETTSTNGETKACKKVVAIDARMRERVCIAILSTLSTTYIDRFLPPPCPYADIEIACDYHTLDWDIYYARIPNHICRVALENGIVEFSEPRAQANCRKR